MSTRNITILAAAVVAALLVVVFAGDLGLTHKSAPVITTSDQPK